MKKWLSFGMAIILSFSGVFTSSARQEALLSVFIEKPILGESSAYRFIIEQLPFELGQETILLTFPSYFQLPQTIQPEDILISNDHAPHSVQWMDLRNLLIEADFSGTKSLDIYITGQAGISNPVEWSNSSVFAMAFHRTDFIVVSNAIQLRSPNNTVKLFIDEAPNTPDTWHAKAVKLSFASSLTKEIRYILKARSEESYLNEITLNEGIYEIAYWGIRSSGAAESQKQELVRIDTSSPQLTLLSPKNNDLTNQEKMELKFQVKDISRVRIAVQGLGEYLVSPNGQGIIPITLKPGVNHFNYTATDEAGHVSWGGVSLMLDITPPYLNILSPRNDDIICTSRVDIVGKTEIDSKVWLGDVPVNVDRFGNFVMQWVPQLGKNQLTVRAIDRAGNETRREIQFFAYPGIVIEAGVGKNTATVNGNSKEMQPAPFVDRQTGELYFPLRFMAETLSYELKWVAQGSYVSMKKEGWEIRIRSLDPLVQIRSGDQIEDVRLQFVPTIYQGSMMIPAEFIKRILAGNLLLDPDVKKVIIHFCEKTGA